MFKLSKYLSSSSCIIIIVHLKETYTEHDVDKNGYFDKSEFADILEQIGKNIRSKTHLVSYFLLNCEDVLKVVHSLNVPHPSRFHSFPRSAGLSVHKGILHALSIRFSDREGHVRFDDFVACAVKLKIAISKSSFVS